MTPGQTFSGVAGVLKLIADVVRDTRELVEALNDGRKFLAAKHPEAESQFAELLEQMEKTVVGLSQVTALVTSFGFVSERGKIPASEAVRFNNYVMDQRKQIVALRSDIRKLKGNCDKVRAIRDDLNKRAKGNDWSALFGLLNVKSKKRAGELAGIISNFYADDQRMLDVIGELLKTADRALTEAERALGSPGQVYVSELDTAAAVLAMYAAVFGTHQADLDALADAMHETASSLR